MNSLNRSPLFGSNHTNCQYMRTTNNPYNCCDTSSASNIMSGVVSVSGVVTNTTNRFDEVYNKLSQISTPFPQNSFDTNSNNTKVQNIQYMSPTFPTYPPMSTITSRSYGPTYTFANQSLITNTTNSQSIPTSCSAFYTSRISQNESTHATNDCIKGCNDSKEELKVLMSYLESIRKNNEEFQSKLLNELKEVKKVMIEMSRATNELPLRFSDALTNSLASVQSRSNSISIDSEAELVDILDSFEISKNIEDEETEETTDLSQMPTQNRETNNEKSNDIKSSTIDKFIFPYESTIDMNKWLKKA